jgi:sulfoxide reductase heme-binding subunit YedZ
VKLFFTNKYLIWALLALPAIPFISEFFVDERYYGELMHLSGVWASALLVVTLSVSPLRDISQRFRNHGGLRLNPLLRWLMRNRRCLGVATMCYGIIHTIFYVIKLGELQTIFVDALRLEILTGWLSLLILLMLGITSNNYSVRAMGTLWSKTHRFSYGAAVLVFIHWYMFDYKYQEIYFWFIPLLVIQILRMYLLKIKRSNSPTHINY